MYSVPLTTVVAGLPGTMEVPGLTPMFPVTVPPPVNVTVVPPSTANEVADPRATGFCALATELDRQTAKIPGRRERYENFSFSPHSLMLTGKYLLAHVNIDKYLPIAV